ncbi:hypothetical protein LTR84_007142 [Exophiala bonariae]|uniref:Xylanolytic transcriptional activator regulatory domain-containing protein n=1 Tax=Exophiala bonariae TaxID=1690606 RepID=A0AAV9N197_9EURO|nr:hypothetical protein LTR84_007142 [Exophiala bonariae]
MKRGLSSECHLESVILTKDKRALSTGKVLHRHPIAFTSPDTAVDPRSSDLAEAYTSATTINDNHLRDPSLETFGVLENLAWGRQSDTPQSVTPGRSMIHELGEDGLDEAYPGILSPQQEDAILAFHRDEIAWMHNVLHVPTFLAEWAERRQQPRERWLALDALYLALMATGLYYMSPAQHEHIGIRAGYRLSERLYHKTVMVLDKIDFMYNQSIHAVQAICVFLPCVYGFGEYKRGLVLLSIATTIAQSMQLHRLDSGIANVVETGTTDVLELEIKRRIWCFLVTQDTYLIAAKKTYTIILEHCSVKCPLHVEEPCTNSGGDVLLAVPLEHVTQNSYMLLHYHMSQIFRTLHSRNGPPPAEPPSLERLYQRVLDADEQLTEFMELAPSWLKLDAQNGLEDGESSPHTSSTTASQRRSFRIAYLNMRSKIHQPFYCRAFTDKKFYYSKATCLDTARSLLRIFADPTEQTLPLMWTATSHVIYACITIGIHLLFPQRGSHNPESSWTTTMSGATDKALVSSCMNVLNLSKRPCRIVSRGLRMLNHLFNQQRQQIPANMIVDRARIESVLQDNETSPSEEEQEDELPPASPFHYPLDEFVGSFELYTSNQGYSLDDFSIV